MTKNRLWVLPDSAKDNSTKIDKVPLTACKVVIHRANPRWSDAREVTFNGMVIGSIHVPEYGDSINRRERLSHWRFEQYPQDQEDLPHLLRNFPEIERKQLSEIRTELEQLIQKRINAFNRKEYP